MIYKKGGVIMSKRKTHKEFMGELLMLNPKYTVLSEYTNNKTKITCKCNICGHEWEAYPYNMLQGKGCVVCGNKKSADKRRKTNEQFLLELKNITTTIIPLENYKGALEKIWVRCTECGNQWQVEPHSLLQGKGCNVCSSIRGGIKQRKTHEQFVNELREKYPTLIVNSEYITMHHNVNFTCSVCHNTFDRIASDVFYDGGCPICNVNNLPQRQPKSLEQFLQDLFQINNDIVYLDGYVKASEKLHVKCKICGHDWWPIGTSLTSGFGCPVCNMSHGERKIRDYLCDHNYRYISQKTFSGLVGVGGGDLSYDFYLPNYNLLIEYQGEFHDGTARMQTEIELLRQQEHDKRKRTYAQKHNMDLLEIWYNNYNNIEQILNDYLTQQNDLYYKNPVTTTVI